MADRWNMGNPARGEAFHSGFVSPWNAGTLDHDGSEIGLMPSSHIPETMGGQMDGDQQTTFTGGGKAKRAKK